MGHCLARTIASRFVAAALAAAMAIPAAAQTYPVRPVRIIVGFAPGGAVDVSARALARRLGEALPQTFIVENRVGGSGNVAGGIVAKSPPDGYTLYMASSAIALPGLFANLPFDVHKDLTPISLVALGPSVLAVHPSVPVRTVKELVALAKARPDQLSYGSAGFGTVTHLATELLMFRAGIRMVHVPYKGGGPSIVGLMSGEVHLVFSGIAGVISQLQAGRVRAVAVSTLKRSASLPNVPTVHETALPGYDTSSWYGLLGPAGMPRHVLDLLAAEIGKIMRGAEVRDTFVRLGFDPEGSTPDAFGAFIRAEIAKYQSVIDRANLKPIVD